MSDMREFTFHDLFGPEEGEKRWQPNSGQRLLAELTENLDETYLAIVESPTGSGKTEAFAYSYALRKRKGLIGTGGLYVGLPTMATTNAMFSRVKEYLHRLYRGSNTSLILAQSEAFMNEDYKALLAAGRSGNDSSDSVKAYDWFNGRKRTLLSQNAVGTVDQIMLAGMLTKHQFVRMLGLFDKTVVIDEIHAYDTYMSSIICDLLSWLHAIGTPVILLSATLPKYMKQDLLASYAGVPSIDEGSLEDGPNITVCTSDSITSVPLSDIPSRTITLRIVDSEFEDDRFSSQIAEVLIAEVGQGGCIGCILNTVRDAQSVVRKVIEAIDPSIPIILAHSRFTREDRKAWEKRLLTLLGPEAEDRPDNALIIGTQVLEQSLDIDFDVLVTDIAPIDLLIQRAGRLHRHTRDQRVRVSPVMTVVSPDRETLRFRPGTATVYLPAVLAKSVIALTESNGHLTLPGDDGELLSMVYGDVDVSPLVSSAIRDKIIKWEDEAIGAGYAQRSQADHVSLSSVDAYRYEPGLGILADKCFELDDERIATRLGGISIDVVLLDEGLSDTSDPKRLIERSIKVTSAHAVKKLIAVKVPEIWQKHWFLSEARPLVFRDSQASIDQMIFTYSSDTGLMIQ